MMARIRIWLLEAKTMAVEIKIEVGGETHAIKVEKPEAFLKEFETAAALVSIKSPPRNIIYLALGFFPLLCVAVAGLLFLQLLFSSQNHGALSADLLLHILLFRSFF